MSWGAVIAGAATLVGGYMSNKGAKDAAKSSAKGGDAAIAEQQRQFDLTRQDQQPWLLAGQDALARQRAALNGDFSGFKESPDYTWARKEMIQGSDRSAAARGGLYSGGYQADLAERINGLASQNFNNYWNRLAGQAGQGQVAANNLGQLGSSMASNVGAIYQNQANIRGSYAQQQADTNAQVVGAIGGIANNWYQGQSAKNGGGTGWYLGNNPGRG